MSRALGCIGSICIKKLGTFWTERDWVIPTQKFLKIPSYKNPWENPSGRNRTLGKLIQEGKRLKDVDDCKFVMTGLPISFKWLFLLWNWKKRSSHPSVSTGNWLQDLCGYQNGRKLKSHSWSLVSEVPHPWIQPTMDCVVLNHTSGHTQFKPMLLTGQLYFHILVMDLDLKIFCCLFFCFNFLKGKSLWISSRLIMWYTHLNHTATF